MKKFVLLLFVVQLSFAQNYWQQHVEYEMDINMDVSDFTFDGEQKLVYTNNSPDTITKVYYHLFFNAFQPGSQMDIRSRTIKDPDRRVGSRIFELEEKDYGKLNISSLKQDGKNTVFEERETVLFVRLAEPLMPGEKTTLEMVFKGQVPYKLEGLVNSIKKGLI